MNLVWSDLAARHGAVPRGAPPWRGTREPRRARRHGMPWRSGCEGREAHQSRDGGCAFSSRTIVHVVLCSMVQARFTYASPWGRDRREPWIHRANTSASFVPKTATISSGSAPRCM